MAAILFSVYYITVFSALGKVNPKTWGSPMQGLWSQFWENSRWAGARWGILQVMMEVCVRSEGKGAFPNGAAYMKSQRWERTWHFPETARGLVCQKPRFVQRLGKLRLEGLKKLEQGPYSEVRTWWQWTIIIREGPDLISTCSLQCGGLWMRWQ